jgi:branched-chain amino acid transport system substrate-binding protein
MVQAGGGSDMIFTQGRKFVFGMFPRASRQFYTFRDFFRKLGKASTFTIIYLNTPYNKFLADGAKKALEEVGFKILQSIELPAQVNDVSGVLSTVRDNPPDVLLWFSSDEITMLAAKQMVMTNTYVKMLFFSLGPYTVAFRESLGKHADGIISQEYWTEGAAYKGDIFGRAQDFANYYRQNFKRPLLGHMAAGGACIVAYVHAIQNANSLDPVKVRNALAALDVMTFYGRLKFTQDGDAVAELLGPIVIQVQKGKVEMLYPPEAATAEVIFPMTPWEKR